MNFDINCLFLILTITAFCFAAEEVCQKSACKKLSDDLVHRSMNQSVSPCDDFYEHVCGNWADHHPMTGKEDLLNAFAIRQKLVMKEVDDALLNALNSSSSAVKYVAELYSSCIDTESWEKQGVKHLVESVEKILGAWPMVTNSKLNTNNSQRWPDLFANVYSQAGISPLFRIRSYHRLEIQPGTTGLNPHATNPQKPNETVIENYKTFLRKASVILGAVDNEKLTKDIDQLIHFEQKLQKAALQSGWVWKKHYYNGTIESFNIATHNRVDWLAMLNKIRTNLKAQVPEFNASSMIENPHVDYTSMALEVLDITPIDVIQNFFAWQITITYGMLTSAALRNAVLEFRGDKMVVTDLTTVCARLPMNWPFVMARIYIDTHFRALERVEAVKMVAEIKASFRRNLETNTWLDGATKQYALEKLDAVHENIGNPEWIMSNEELDNLYQLKNEKIEKGNFFANILQFSAHRMRSDLEELNPAKKPKTDPRWKINPATVNAFYARFDNSITIPAGILQPPFFDEDMPFSMNYGAIGTIIGHEYTHGFDSNGRQYDLHGNRTNWWTNETLTKFEEKAKCFIEQYSKNYDPVAAMNISGNLTLTENTADNGGIKESFLAYKTHMAKFGGAKVLPNLKFNSDQLFFVSYANIWCSAATPERLKQLIKYDQHAPAKLRVNVVLSNMPQFAQAFQCPAGSKMNPTHKCSVW